MKEIRYVLVALAGGLITFYAYLNVASMQRLILLFDAAGLALFAVVGGGMTRDVLAGAGGTRLERAGRTASATR